MAYKPFGARAQKPTEPADSKPVKKRLKTRRIQLSSADHRARRGRITASEKSIITGVIAETPGDLTVAQTQALAIALKRDPDTIADAVADARQKLQENLGRYVDIHKEAAELALQLDDPDVARKAAEFMIEKVSAKRRDGKVERLIDAPTSDNQGPRIQIGIALGGMPTSAGATTIDNG